MQQYVTTLIGVMGFITMVIGIIEFVRRFESLRRRLRSTLIIVFGAILISPLLIDNLFPLVVSQKISPWVYIVVIVAFVLLIFIKPLRTIVGVISLHSKEGGQKVSQTLTQIGLTIASGSLSKLLKEFDLRLVFEGLPFLLPLWGMVGCFIIMTQCVLPPQWYLISTCVLGAIAFIAECLAIYQTVVNRLNVKFGDYIFVIVCSLIITTFMIGAGSIPAMVIYLLGIFFHLISVCP